MVLPLLNIIIPDKYLCQEYQEDNTITAICRKGNDTITIRKTGSGYLDNKSAYADFAIAFRHYHFEPFFENIYFDKKLRRLYRDSITIDTMMYYQTFEQTIIPCYGCNVVAIIQFRNQKYVIPHLLNEDLMYYFNHYQQSFDKTESRISTFFFPSMPANKPFLQVYTESESTITEVHWNNDKKQHKTISKLEYPE